MSPNSNNSAPAITPLMAQYQEIKSAHKDAVLFFRLGDFYEMFDDDAVEVSRLLNLTLTQRTGRPMCGIPFHASKIYIARLLRLGKRIAICEQLGEVPAKGKDLTKRGVTEIISPGSVTENEYLEEKTHNYIACIFFDKMRGSLSFIDVSTRSFFATSFDLSEASSVLPRELGRIPVRELIFPDDLRITQDAPANEALRTLQQLISENTFAVSYYPNWHFSYEKSYKTLTASFKTANLRPFSLSETSVEIVSAGFLLEYLSHNLGNELAHIDSITVYGESDYVQIDDSSRRNLEICASLKDGSTQYTLLETVDFTCTAMGSRLVRFWLNFPVRNIAAIKNRQEKVAHFLHDKKMLKAVREKLKNLFDIERLTTRIVMDRAHPKDLRALCSSIAVYTELQHLLGEKEFSHDAELKNIVSAIDNAIAEDPPVMLEDGNVIKSGYSKALDNYRKTQTDFTQILNDYAQIEKEKTGIANLKIRYTHSIGYYIEISKGKLAQVPSHFILRRTMVTGDRYTTERLQELQDELMNSAHNILEEEKRIFLEVRSSLKSFQAVLFAAAETAAFIDCTASFAWCAFLQNWVCPQFETDTNIFCVRDGRHPVVEKHLAASSFVPNNAELGLDSDGSKTLSLITGPNMAGKSTYLRQNALIALLAHTGSFVPAAKARLSVTDRIFCRIGASDNLARGESTFLVEMTEAALILRQATENSIVIMDEIGRGTSTTDGIAIAWAICEYLLNNTKCKTFFATHYHELARIEHPRIKLLCLEVLENEGEIVFLKKIKEGESTSSFGIHVARLAGIPDNVIQRASELGGIAHNAAVMPAPQTVTTPALSQKVLQNPESLFSTEELIINDMLGVKPENITPIEALTLIMRWQKTLLGK